MKSVTPGTLAYAERSLIVQLVVFAVLGGLMVLLPLVVPADPAWDGVRHTMRAGLLAPMFAMLFAAVQFAERYRRLTRGAGVAR